MTRGGKVFKPAHLRCDNPTTETEAKKESQVAEEDNEVIKQLKNRILRFGPRFCL